MTSVNRYRLALVGLVFVVMAPVWAGEPAYDLEIEPQPLAKALKAFAEQSGLQVVYYSELADGEESPEVSGTMTADQAMTQLLASTDLTFDTMGEDTVVVETVAIGVADERGASDSKNLETATPVLMAQNQTSPTQTIRSQSDNQQSESDQSEEERESRGRIETIVVYGSRNTGIRRYENDAQPYVVFDDLEIERSSATNINEFLRTRLPMNSASVSFAQEESNVFGNQSQIDLRGLGPDQTLILVNGRRMPSVAVFGDFSQPDINGIPVGAVERIEVLPTTAAGIYGGGATGGAINIILKRNYSGFDLSVGYEDTTDLKAAQTRIEGTAGFTLENGRTSIMVSASHSDSDELLVGERDFATSARELALSNDPDYVLNGFFPVAGLTPNIRNADGSDLVLDTGASLSSPVTYVPIGYSGADSDGGAALLANAGMQNIDLPDASDGRRSSITSNPAITSFTVNARREFSDWLDISLDSNFFRNKGRRQTGLNITGALLPADSPNNPFTTDVRVRFPVPGFSREATAESTTVNAILGAVIKWNENWSTHLEYGWNRARLESMSSIQAAGFSLLSAINAGDNPDLNIIRDTNEFPINVEPFALPDPSETVGPFDTELTNLSLRSSGTLTQIPGVPVTISMLLERRSEDILNGFVDEADFFTGEILTRLVPASKQSVDTAYVEALVPLLSASNGGLTGPRLEIQLAARHDSYETFSRIDQPPSIVVDSRQSALPDVTLRRTDLSSTDYTVGARFRPLEDLLLRASYGTGFLPPRLRDLRPFQQPTSTTLAAILEDPKRGGALGTNTQPIDVVILGNPELRPEESESWSVGAIFTPRVLDGLRVSVDYTRIEKTDEIGSIPGGIVGLFAAEDIFPGRIERLPLTPEDAALGYTGGEVIGIDFSLINLASSRVEAYDLQINYEWDTDSGALFDAYVVGTYQESLETALLSSIPQVDRVGFSDGPLQKRANFGLDWIDGAWSAGWNAQYYDSYIVYGSSANDATIELEVVRQGTVNIPSQLYHDVYVAYDFGNSSRFVGELLRNADIRLGIQNIFDKAPPILATTNVVTGYSTYGDPRLQRFSLQIRKSF